MKEWITVNEWVPLAGAILTLSFFGGVTTVGALYLASPRRSEITGYDVIRAFVFGALANFMAGVVIAAAIAGA